MIMHVFVGNTGKREVILIDYSQPLNELHIDITKDIFNTLVRFGVQDLSAVSKKIKKPNYKMKKKAFAACQQTMLYAKTIKGKTDILKH